MPDGGTQVKITNDAINVVHAISATAAHHPNPLPLPTADEWELFWQKSPDIPAHFIVDLGRRFHRAGAESPIDWAEFAGFESVDEGTSDAGRLAMYTGQRTLLFFQVWEKLVELAVAIWPHLDKDFPTQFKGWTETVQSTETVANLYCKLRGVCDSKVILALCDGCGISPLAEAAQKRLTKEQERRNKMHSQQRQTGSAFTSPKFIDHDGYLNDFREAVENMTLDFANPRKTYLAPLMPMIQASGVGKSRLAIEYGKLYPSVYVCLRDKDSTGFPECSEYAGLFVPNFPLLYGIFKNVTKSESVIYVAYYLSLFTAFVQMATRHVKAGKKFPSEWLARQDWQNGGAAIHEELKQKLAESIASCIGEGPNDPELKDYDAASRVYLWAVRLLRTAVKSLEDAIQAQTDPKDVLTTNAFKTFTFFIDECRLMLKPTGGSSQNQFFFYFRLATHFFPKAQNIKFAIVVLDTFGSVVEYIPQTIVDSSLRYVVHKDLFPPYCRFQYQCRNDDELKQPVDEASIEANLAKTGRFLWNASPINDAIEVAKCKLLLSQKEHLADVTDERVLAIMGSRLALQFHAHKKLALDLVHSHGAYLFHVSDDRQTVMMGYPSEPILAESAAQLQVAAESKFSWSEILPKLLYFVSTGVVEAGVRGELIARVILLIAMDVARCALNTKLMSMPVKVANFFTSLFGANRVETMKQEFSDANRDLFFNKGQMNFTHFVYVAGPLQHSMLVSFYRRFAAVLCRRNQETIDLLLPVWLGDDRYSAVLVQVKNYEKGTGFPIIPHDLMECISFEGESLDQMNAGPSSNDTAPQSSQVPFVYLFLQHGPYQDKKNGVWSILENGANGRLKFAAKKNNDKSGQNERDKEAPTTPSLNVDEPATSMESLLSVAQQSSVGSNTGSSTPVTSIKPLQHRCLVGALNISETVYPLFDATQYKHSALRNWMGKEHCSMIIRTLRQLRRAWVEPLSTLRTMRDQKRTKMSASAFAMTKKSYFSVLQLTYLSYRDEVDDSVRKRPKRRDADTDPSSSSGAEKKTKRRDGETGPSSLCGTETKPKDADIDPSSSGTENKPKRRSGDTDPSSLSGAKKKTKRRDADTGPSSLSGAKKKTKRRDGEADA